VSALRILVVDDSLTARKRLVEVLEAAPGFEVVGEAEDGKKAIELCLALKPDAITMDMMMPVMSGLSATEYIMAYRPTPILIVSSSNNRGELFKMYEALAAGALDVMEKPDGEEADPAWEARLLGTLKLIARIKVITHPRGRMASRARERSAGEAASIAPPGASGVRALFLGASTGGPGAVRDILRGLPGDYPLPIVVVIHLGKAFSSALAEWLDSESPLRVAFASQGEPLPEPGQGRVLMAPPDRHLVLRGGKLWLENGPEVHSCRPSVDRLFESAAEALGPRAAGALLTGMGRDGAEGLLALRRAGALTAAQDEASSVIYGMPREAALLGAADRILPLEAFAPLFMELARGAK
jgi:two-component system chemotaxis response regulator CheB